MAELQGIWTAYGQEKIAAWLTSGEPMTITHGAVGDGNGLIPTVSPAQAALVNEVWRGPINGVQLNPEDPTEVIVDLVIPNSVGGFWVREWGLFDDSGKLIAVGPHEEMRKPVITQGQAAEFLERFLLPITNSGAITLTIASQALATQNFVRAEVGQHNADAAAHQELLAGMQGTAHAEIEAHNADPAAHEELFDSLESKISAGNEAAGQTATWDGVSGKPESYPADAHAATHATGGADAITLGALGITWGTEELEPGLSPLATGTIYIQYE